MPHRANYALRQPPFLRPQPPRKSQLAKPALEDSTQSDTLPHTICPHKQKKRNGHTDGKEKQDIGILAEKRLLPGT